MYRFAFALALALALALTGFTNASVTDCGVTPVFTITSLTLDPLASATVGQNVSLGLMYNSPVLVSGGKVTTSITYNFIPFAPSVSDLCTTRNIFTLSSACPITVGIHDGSAWYLMPAVSGSITTKILWTDDNGAQLLCISLSLKVSQR